MITSEALATEWVSTGVVSALLDVHRYSVWRWASEGTIPAYQRTSRRWLVHRDWVRQELARRDEVLDRIRPFRRRELDE